MGAEARCKVRFGKEVGEGKALLETDEIRFRGEPRLKIPLKDVKKAEAKDGVLRVTFSGGVAAFELGEAAERWAQKILSPKSLLDKLGVKPGSRVVVLGVDDAAFLRDLEARAGDVSKGRPRKDADFVFYAAETPADLKKVASLVPCLKPAGALWIVSPKGKPEIKDTVVMAAAKAAGLTDTKVVRWSGTHTALKFVIPVAKRAK
jgi:hypothetical protein